MFTANSVLVATDFSETSDRALEAAVELASRFDGRVTLLHAYEIPALGFPDGILVASSDAAAQMSIAAQRALDEQAARFNGRAPIRTTLREGTPYDTINEVADEVDAGVIIIGTHGRRGIARALLGSMAENVIRTARRPVLVIHGPRDGA